MRLPVPVFWLSRRRRLQRQPRAFDPLLAEQILEVRARPDCIGIDIRVRQLRAHLPRSQIARVVGSRLIISNTYRRRLIGPLPLLGTPRGNFGYLLRYALPFELRRDAQRLRCGFDAAVAMLGPEPRRMSPAQFGDLVIKAVEANLAADGYDWLEYYRSYVK